MLTDALGTLPVTSSADWLPLTIGPVVTICKSRDVSATEDIVVSDLPVDVQDRLLRTDASPLRGSEGQVTREIDRVGGHWHWREECFKRLQVSTRDRHIGDCCRDPSRSYLRICSTPVLDGDLHVNARRIAARQALGVEPLSICSPISDRWLLEPQPSALSIHQGARLLAGSIGRVFCSLDVFLEVRKLLLGFCQ